MCVCVCVVDINRSGLHHTPSNVRGCQPVTWSAGQENIVGTSTKLQREHEKNKGNKNTKHVPEKDRRRAHRELSHPTRPPGSQLLASPNSICTQRHSIYKSVHLGSQICLSAQSTPREESLGQSNQRGSETSRACYSYPRFNLNLVRHLRFSLSPLVFGRILLLFHPRGHKPTAPFTYCAVPDPMVKCGGAPAPRDAK